MRRFRWFELALSVVFLSATIYAALSDAYNLPNRWFIRDDAYYYYKVAQNISQGLGSTFDGVHATNGYHPLWMLICVPIFALARIDLILPLRVLALVTGLLQLGTAIISYRLIRQVINEQAGVLAACFWAFNTYILVFLYKTGVESPLTMFLVVWLLYALMRFELRWRDRQTRLREFAGLAVLAALVTFGRLDLIFFSLIVGIWVVFRARPIRYLLPMDILAVVMSVVAAFITRLGFADYYDVSATAIITLSAALLVKLPILFLLGGYERPALWNFWRSPARLALACAAGSAALALILLAGSATGLLPGVSRVVLALDLAFTFVLLLIIRIGAAIFRTSTPTVEETRPIAMWRSSWPAWLAEGAVFYGIVGGALGTYMLWNRLAFGTFSPVSGQIKHWWGTFTHSIYGTAASNWLTFLALNPFSDFNAFAPATTTLSDLTNRLLYDEGTGYGNPRWQANFVVVLLFAALMILVIPALRRRFAARAVVGTALIPLFVGSWLQILAYNITGYASPKEWYWLIEPLALIVAASIGLGALCKAVLDRWRLTRYALWAVVAWYGIAAGFGYWRDAYLLNPYGEHPPSTPQSPIIPFLEHSTPPGAMIGMTGGGNIGYLMPDRTIVNMDGLINSYEYFEALQAGTGADYLYDTGLRYVFANGALLDANPYRGQFSERLELIVEWGGKDLFRVLPRAPD